MTYRRLRVVFIATALLAATVSTAPAAGLLDKNLHYFAPTIDGSGLITTYGSEPLGMYRMYYGLFVDDAMNILDYEAPPDSEETTLITNQAAISFVYGIGFWKYVNLGLGLGYIPYRTFDDSFTGDDEYPHPFADENPDLPGTDIGEDTDEAGLEDVRLDLKLIGIDRQERCLGVALITTVAFPLNYKSDQFLSDGGTTVAPRLIVDFGRTWYTLAVNGGYKFFAEKSRAQLPGLAQDTDLDATTANDFTTEDEIMGGAGVKFRFSYGSEIVLDSQFKTQAPDPFGDDRVDYAEVMGAYRRYFRGLNYTLLTIGSGVGLMDGMGNPSVRIFVGVSRDEKRVHLTTY